MEHESDGDTSCIQRARCRHQRIAIGSGGLGNKRTGGDHPNDGIVEISDNTKKNPGELKRLAVTQVPVENHRLTLV